MYVQNHNGWQRCVQWELFLDECKYTNGGNKQRIHLDFPSKNDIKPPTSINKQIKSTTTH